MVGVTAMHRKKRNGNRGFPLLPGVPFRPTLPKLPATRVRARPNCAWRAALKHPPHRLTGPNWDCPHQRASAAVSMVAFIGLPALCVWAGTSVQLARDLEARDAYGRLLAYVIRSADGTA